MSKRFLVVLLAVVAVFVGVFLLTNKHKVAAPAANGGTPSNHIFGSGQKSVTLVEYGDFQCSACGAYYPLVKEITTKYQSDIFFQFRNFPLTSIHPNAFAGSRAAEAADKQGKYWEMHDLLYEQQQSWSTASNPETFFEGYAQQLGMDVNKFKQDIAAADVNAVINADMGEGNKLGVDATPTFFLDGKKIDNPRDQDSFNKLIDDEIAAKTKQ